MHCRPSTSINSSTCSFSFLFIHSDYTETLNNRPCLSSSYHDQLSIPPSSSSQRRRRLEDPIITYASNHYVSCPQQASHSPLLSSQSPSLSSSRRIDQPLKDKSIYCDLFNLLERPPSIKQRKKYTLNDFNPGHRHHSIDFKNAHAKVKEINEQKRHHQPSYYKEKRHQENKLSSIEQYDRLQEKAKNHNCFYQQRLPRKGFFRRVARNYFCMPVAITNGEFST